MSYTYWKLAVTDRVAALTLNRPEANNTFTVETFQELRRLIREIRERSDIWALVLQGEGAHFSAGVDMSVLAQMIGQSSMIYREVLTEFQDALNEFEALEKPTIAKIRGYCIGGAILLALCCDFRIAAEGASFSLPEVKRGIAVVMGTRRITRVTGVGAAKQLILLGERFSAQEAYRYNLLHQVVAEDELEGVVAHLAAKFRHLPPRTVSAAKRIIDRGLDMSLHDSLEMEINIQADLLHSSDFAEAITSFLEKRPPQFSGK